jgi:uncharacterized Ntn-hydrolase superfamily protein
MVELNTFSITARCKQTGMLGVAVSTARPAVGSLAPYAKAGVGAISTQALVNPYYGVDGLRYLSERKDAKDVLPLILSKDEDRERRQVAIVDAKGNTAAFTGSETVPWQGHIEGDQFVVAGNMLTGPETLEAMVKTYESLNTEPFPERMLQTLQAGQQAGGDKRGKQSAALYIVHEEEYPYVDIRVDEHQNPVQELMRVYEVCQKDLFPYTQQMVKRNQGKS